MYDYVLQYGFDKETEQFVQSIKNYLKENKIKDEERNWLPHITIDLYNCKDQETFINKLDNIISNIKRFNVRFINLNDFNGKILYIEPFAIGADIFSSRVTVCSIFFSLPFASKIPASLSNTTGIVA